jgi:hypothetical protein
MTTAATASATDCLCYLPQSALIFFMVFTPSSSAYDVIYDAVGKHSFMRCRGSLKRGGVYFGWPTPHPAEVVAAWRRDPGMLQTRAT